MPKLTQQEYNESAKARLKAKVTIADAPNPVLATPCWNHGGAPKSPSDHSSFYYSYGGVTKHYAHQASYIIHKGEIPEGLHVRHKCDNPACVNPDHLDLGTHQDNMADKALRGSTRAKSGIKGVYPNANGWRAKVTLRGETYTFFNKCKDTVIAWVEEKRSELHGAGPAGLAY